MTLRSFIDLLPSRLDQALIGDSARRLRVARRRTATTPVSVSGAEHNRRLFIDMSVINVHDAATGIQRVVRAIASGIAGETPDDSHVQFVAANRKEAYHTIDWQNPDTILLPHKMTGGHGDVFLGLDYSLDTVRWYESQLGQFRRNGGKIWFLVHDLLPLDRPEWFRRNTVIRFKRWLEILAGISDGFFCNSADTEIRLRQVMSATYGLKQGIQTKVLPMGHCVLEGIQRNTRGAASDRNTQLRISGSFILMVGTLEPRKGYGDVISAFNLIWEQGRQEQLVLIGRLGWEVDELKARILSHPKFGKQLFWFDDVEDLELEDFYKASEGVMVPSQAEGFGLPVIEALGHGKPVLVRELPVFKPHARYGAHFFPADANDKTLAGCIIHWMEDIRAGRTWVIRPEGSWRQSARELLRTIGVAENHSDGQNCSATASRAAISPT